MLHSGQLVPTPSAAHAALVGVLVLATAVWVGGFVALVVVARAARHAVSMPERIAFFRAVGRSYGVVAGVALVVGLASGAVLLAGRSWTGSLVATVVVAGLLVAATVVGVAQARRMTRLRRRALDDAVGLTDRLRRAARRAALLRGGIGVLSLALFALGAALLG